MARYGISPFDNDSATFAHSEISSLALKTISGQMSVLAETGQLEKSMIGHLFILAIDLARFPMELHKFTKQMNDEWQKLLRDYIDQQEIISDSLQKALKLILEDYFWWNEKQGYIKGFNTIVQRSFSERREFIALAAGTYFEKLLEYLKLCLEDWEFLRSWHPDRITIPAYLDLYVSLAREVPEQAKGRVTKEEFDNWKAAYYAWFEENSAKIPKKYRTIDKINMDELFEEFEYYAV